MTFRYARHTNNVEALIQFYTEVIGLDVLGRFEKHDNYKGVFLGFPDTAWHIEFTESNDQASHAPDDDDLLVFYLQSSEEISAIQKDAERLGATTVQSKNPYWQEHGVQINDPDGFGVIVSVKDVSLVSDDPTTQRIKEKEISTWDQMLHHVRHIPYGRNKDRTKFDLVLTNNKGTCSSKHALLKQVADTNQIAGVKLIMAMYKMNEVNTPGIGNHLTTSGLAYVPEAHCYLMLHGKRVDLTNPQSDIRRVYKDILEEIEIVPTQVGQYKVEYHKEYIQKWLQNQELDLTFEQVWAIREKCIAELSS